jgi:hypothetical protein
MKMPTKIKTLVVAQLQHKRSEMLEELAELDEVLNELNK